MEAASTKPMELERYLFQPSFSLQSHVVPKSTTIPEKPTMQNFTNFKIKVLSIIGFEFDGFTIHRTVNEVVETDDKRCIRNERHFGCQFHTPTSRNHDVFGNRTRDSMCSIFKFICNMQRYRQLGMRENEQLIVGVVQSQCQKKGIVSQMLFINIHVNSVCSLETVNFQQVICSVAAISNHGGLFLGIGNIVSGLLKDINRFPLVFSVELPNVELRAAVVN